jgi:uncharacterized membrane protein
MPSRSIKRTSPEPHTPLRLLRLHLRLLFSIALGIVVLLVTVRTGWRLPTRLLTGWDAGAVCYLVFTFRMMGLAAVDEIRRRAALHDEGALIIPLLTAAAAIASLVAVVAEFGEAPSTSAWEELALGMFTIVLSWLFMHTIFALHYAHEYYGEHRDARVGGLDFPGKQEPDYWDFLYFSFVIAMTSQVSDVQITGKVIRRIVNIHGVLSFFFNLSILALTVNMVSNLIKPG